MKLSLEKKIFLTLGLFATGILLVVILVIFPMTRRITTVNRESSERRETLAAEHTTPINLREIIQTIRTLKTTTAVYPEHLFRAGDELTLITALEKIATQHQVSQKIETANFDAVNNQKASISVTVNGSYTAIMRYLTDVEGMPYFITPEQITLSPAESSNPSQPVANASLHLVLSLYVNP